MLSDILEAVVVGDVAIDGINVGLQVAITRQFIVMIIDTKGLRNWF